MYVGEKNIFWDFLVNIISYFLGNIFTFLKKKLQYRQKKSIWLPTKFIFEVVAVFFPLDITRVSQRSLPGKEHIPNESY